MIQIVSSADLRKFGLRHLTGESCGLGTRILFDFTERGRMWIAAYLGIPPDQFRGADPWNGNGSVGSILFDRSLWPSLAVFGALSCGYSAAARVQTSKLDLVIAAYSADEEEYRATLLHYRSEEPGADVREFSFRGTGGSRNIHEMSTRVT